jgi:hypothetical protein
MVQLGDKVKDKISGFTGIAVARTDWLYGCIRITIQPEVSKEGKYVENQTFDEPQLVVLKAGAIKDEKKKPKPTHGDREDVGFRQNVK